MKRSTIIGVVLLLILGVGAIYVSQDKRNTLDLNEMDFALEDTSRVTKIFLSRKGGDKVTLTRENGVWKLDSGFFVREGGINNLLMALHSLSVKAPVTKSKFDNVIRGLSSVGIKVEVYLDGKQVPQKVIYIGGTDNSQTGNYMLLEGAEKPYLVHIEGHNGTVDPMFFAEEKNWRSTKLFAYKYGELQKLEIGYPSTPENNFSIEMKSNDSFDLKDNKGNSFEADKLKVLSYLAQFKKVNFDRYAHIEEKTKLDSIKQLTPRFTLQITDSKGEVKSIKGYPIKLSNEKVTFDKNRKKEEEFDVDRFFGILKTGDLVVCQYNTFDPIEVDPSYFK